MKIPKKVAQKIATECDRYFFLLDRNGSENLYAVDHIEEILSYTDVLTPTIHPEYFYPSSLLTVDILEDGDAFYEKGEIFANRCGELYAIFVNEVQQTYSLLKRISRTELIRKAADYDKVYVFGCGPVVTTVDPDIYSRTIDKCVFYRYEDSLIYYYFSGKSFKYEVSHLGKTLFAHAFLARDSEVCEAVQQGHVYDRTSNISVVDLLSTAPWELFDKYSEISIIPALKNRKRWSGVYRLRRGTSVREFNEAVTKILNEGTPFYIFATLTEDGYKSMQSYIPMNSSVVLVGDKIYTGESNRLMVFTGPAINTFEDAVQMLHNRGIEPTSRVTLWTNNAPRDFKGTLDTCMPTCELVAATSDTIFRTCLYNVNPVVCRALSIVFSRVMVFQQSFRFSRILSFLDCKPTLKTLVRVCCYACLERQSDEIFLVERFKERAFASCVSRVVKALCLFYCIGFCDEDILNTVDVVKHGDLLYSEYVYQQFISTNKSDASIIYDNEHLYALVVTTLEKLTDDESDAFKFIEQKLKYVRLMMPDSTTIPVESLFSNAPLSGGSILN